MSKVNTGRVLVAGLVAGLVIDVVDFVVNVPILGQQWKDGTAALGVREGSVAMQSALGWICLDLFAGLFTAWLYAAIRPRFGAGAKTALCAGFAVWLLEHFALGSLFWNGLYPLALVVSSSVGGLVANLAGGWVGGKLYREDAA